MTEVFLGLAMVCMSSILFSNVFKSYYISKLLAIVLISFFVYIFAHFTDFDTSFIISSAFVSIILAYRIIKREFEIDVKNEAVFLTAFAFFLFLRSLVPDIYGAEKFMDMAILNSVLNADSFPPHDPFLSGERLDVYYYFGHVISAIIAKISMLPPEYGYNIAMAFISAVSISTLYGLSREMNTGWFAVLAFIAGIPYSVYELSKTLISGSLPGYLFYWNSTRIFSDATFGKAITEFPYFSFIHADLHAHVIAIPLKILFLAILYRFYKENDYSLAIPIMNFALFATNSWDAPAFFLLSTFIMLSKDRNYWPLVVLSGILILLFRLEMKTSADFHFSSEFSRLYEFILFWGFFVLFLYARYFDEIKKKPLTLLPALISPVFPPAVLFPVLFHAIRNRDFNDLLVLTASAVIILCEIIVIDFRMNTYFKFYLLAWILLIPAVSEGLKRVYGARRSVAVFLIALMLVYPVVATPVRHYKHDFTLDGLSFMKESNPGDYYAIKFLYGRNAVVVEGVEGSYSYSGRIAVFSASQAVIAWPNHEVHWRNNGEELAERIGDVRAIYTSQCSMAKEIAKKYNADYIIYSEYERTLYGNADFDCLKLAFESHDTKVYSLD